MRFKLTLDKPVLIMYNTYASNEPLTKKETKCLTSFGIKCGLKNIDHAT